MQGVGPFDDSRFDAFFSRLSGGNPPHGWQRELARPSPCGNRLIRIPTGFGKTLGVLAAWLWHRAVCRNGDWPRRLVWCLPTRVLVEQTESAVRDALERMDLLRRSEAAAGDGAVGVYLLMGGAGAGRWHLHPERDAALIGTQDMLLSRALNRGYASPRARWPMEFGLLNQDALWVMDEAQLMDAGLATSGQLQAFRDEDRAAGKSLRPCRTWWMSATLQRAWLEKSPDATELAGALRRNAHGIAPGDRTGHLWDDVRKPMEVVSLAGEKPPAQLARLAQEASERHRDCGSGSRGPTLVVLNTVQRAVEVWKKLNRDKALRAAGTDIRLAHSRFRPAERRTWREAFLSRDACAPGTNRIVVATQVVEAGVDFSAALLVCELAPWPSLVQRFGRCARWGGEGQVVVVDFGYDDDRNAAPYAADELAAAREACAALLEEGRDAGPLHLERFEEARAALLPRLYPYEPRHLLLRHELDELFDTAPDLSGADIDISRFIRSGDERDVQVFWAETNRDGPPPGMKPARDELCSVPFLAARSWLCNGEGLKPGVRAWVWDWLERAWRRAARRDIHPGQTVLVDSRAGGYRCDCGWDPKSTEPVAPLPAGDGAPSLPPEDHADAAEDDESLSETAGRWQTIAAHGLQVGAEAGRIAAAVAPAQAALLHLAGRWHDLGKAHPAFQASIRADDRPERDDIAKAPDSAWPRGAGGLYRIDADDRRRGFRHELASALGLFGVLQRHDPQHPALLGPWRAFFDALPEPPAEDGISGSARSADPTHIEREILALGADDFDLLAYLVCAHHGKVRMAWHASPADQQADDPALRIRGVREGDTLPPLPLAAADGVLHPLPATALDLSPSEAGLSRRTGRSWTERVLRLLGRHGPFALAWLETLLRAADQRASARPGADHLLQQSERDDAGRRLDESRAALARPAAAGAPAAPSGGDSPPCRQLHGDGGRTGGRGVDTGTTRTPYAPTRYVETAVGILNYRQLAPLLAERVAAAELAIADRALAQMPVHDLLLELHRRICGDLTPRMAGRWRLRDVRVGEHRPPPHWRIAVLMRSYADDLDARLAAPDGASGERLIDDLTFAEGRLLHIHPFEDFNGRASRLFLVELLYRLDLPAIDPAASTPEETQRYFAALRKYDRRDPRPLAAIWRQRLARGLPE